MIRLVFWLIVAAVVIALLFVAACAEKPDPTYRGVACAMHTEVCPK